MDVPKSAAIPVIILMAALIGVADHQSAQGVWYGPAYLMVLAIAAWFVGSGFAVILGIFVIFSQFFTGDLSTYPYGPDDVWLNLALRFFSVLGVVLMLGFARSSLEREWLLARTDPLTGALNRQAFFEAVKADNGGKGIALLVFADLNGLKRLNDEAGHEMGDQALRTFAERVRASIRKNDIFARMGGDEFVIFLKVKDEAAAKLVADRLNKTLNLDADSDQTALPCSLGVLLLPDGTKSIDAELRLADQLMYSAKRAKAHLSMALAVGHDGQGKLSFSPGTGAFAASVTSVRTEARQPKDLAVSSDNSPPKPRVA